MALTLYLAMTAAEILNCSCPPEKIAWMACHFSPYSNGISNVPAALPAGSALILNDRIPPCGHDPQTVAMQLVQAAQELAVSRVLLDFQRPNCMETAAIAKAVVAACRCPVAVTPLYARELDCPVFLTPQLRKPLAEQLSKWHDRTVWLEASVDCEIVTVTETDSVLSPAQLPASTLTSHLDHQLHCRYFVELEESCARFTVWRGYEELCALLKDAEAQGVSCAIGLYQQLFGTSVESS